MAYEKQQWDTTSFVNPTRMNHIEEGIKANSDEVASLNNDLANTKKDVSDLNSNLANYGVNTWFIGSSPCILYASGAFLFINNPFVKETDAIMISDTIEIVGLATKTPTVKNFYPHNGGFSMYVEFDQSNLYDGRQVRFEYKIVRN